MLKDQFDPKKNNFDLIRLAAALIVTFAHTYSLNENSVDPLTESIGYEFSGTISVWSFLVISGYLIARSEEYQTTTNFVLARFLRIYPAFFLAIIFETFVVIPIFYEGSLAEYFQHWATFHLHNLLLWPQNPGVPNVFLKLAHPVVNGSLWTIPLEISFYMLLIAVSAVFRTARWVYLILFVAGVAGSIALKIYGINFLSEQPSVLNGITVYPFVVYSTYFWAGVCMWKYRASISVSIGGLVIAVLALYAAHNTATAQVMLTICLPYIVISLATLGALGTRLHNTG